jgi:hypothetical protein
VEKGSDSILVFFEIFSEYSKLRDPKGLFFFF